MTSLLKSCLVNARRRIVFQDAGEWSEIIVRDEGSVTNGHAASLGQHPWSESARRVVSRNINE